MPQTLFDKIWNQHVVSDLGDGYYLLFVDRHLVNDIAARGFINLTERGLTVSQPQLTFATADHTVATLWNAEKDPHADNNPFVNNLRDNARKYGFRLFDVNDPEFGIVHVNSAELGLALPGTTIACGDSHTCTLGAFGSVAWGIGQSEVVHILATQTSMQCKPKNMRIKIEGSMQAGVTAKDVMLHLIRKIGVAGASGHALEFAGEVIRDMSMEQRLTICNMAIETGARFGLIAPDETTFAYLKDKEFAPKTMKWALAVEHWRSLGSDPDAVFDDEHSINISAIDPQISWGTNPAQVIGINDNIPDLSDADNDDTRSAYASAQAYMGLTGGKPIKGTAIDMVFIGSCTNSRLSDLREAAAVAAGRHVAAGVIAWVAPGSRKIKTQAEAEGLDGIFKDAGFHWGSPGCSMCGGSGDEMREQAEAGIRIVSTTNRNFVGRQGPGSRTHLASPVLAVAAAISGCIADVRDLEACHVD